MKQFFKVFFVIFFSIFFMTTAARAQDTEGLTMRELNKNVVSISLLDTALLYSLNYDYTINKYFGLGTSGSVVGGDGEAFGILGVNANVYPVGSDTTALMLTLGGHYLTTGSSTADVDSLSGDHFYGSTGIGIEYRSSFVFRATINMLFNSHDYLVPWPGLTFGYAF